MPEPLGVIKNVLELERSKNFTNSSVSGGMENFINYLNKPEVKAIIRPENITTLSLFFSSYAMLTLDQREYLVNELLTQLDSLPSSDLCLDAKILNKNTQSKESPHQSHTQTRQDPALYASIKSLHGIGERNSKILKKLGIAKIIDLLRYYPRRYQDFSHLKTIDRISYGEELSIIGTISRDVLTRDSRSKKLKIIETAINDGTGTLRLIWFNKPYLQNQLHKGMPVVVSGKIDTYRGRLIMNNPEWEPLDRRQLHTNRIVPIYPLTAGITQRQLRNLIGYNLNPWVGRIKEYLPEKILSAEKLISINQALKQIHFPDSINQLNQAKRRFAFEEIFFLQLGVFIQKLCWVEAEAKQFSLQNNDLKRLEQSLPYKLTDAQNRAVNEILEDLRSGKPMNRLLQGDVGSGKTVVARYAIEAVIKNGAQAAVMAQTSILAEQHFKTLSALMANASSLNNEEMALLTGDTSTKERKLILEKLASGIIKLIIGTHALLEDPVVFNDLQLAVIDEQHRFGVQQRNKLREKGVSPHLLVMTATPIPRSLAMTIYGDLDVSIIDEMPEGRKPIETRLIHPFDRQLAYDLIRDQIKRGFQAFIIYPMVEIENGSEDFTAAVNERERLAKEVFPDLNIALVHGKMRPSEKEGVMRDFRDGKYDILVATTVIEVGVDIPNVTVILIESANQFGLAQLHQMRGRVGRNSEYSYCLLVPNTEDAIENARLSAMIESNDGFELADIDLKLRGPGEFLGTRQSGYLALRFASLTDIQMIEQCRNYVKEIIDDDPFLKKEGNLLLAEELKLRWPEINLN